MSMGHRQVCMTCGRKLDREVRYEVRKHTPQDVTSRGVQVGWRCEKHQLEVENGLDMVHELEGLSA